MEIKITPMDIFHANFPPMSDKDRAEWESAIHELNNRYECHNIGEKDTGWFKCSECGAELHADCIDGFNPDIYVWANGGYTDIHFCPWCGAKVIWE